MKFLKRSLFVSAAVLLSILTAGAADYGLPAQIQQGNILHCFDWPVATVTANLQNIAEAGYGAVQLSPLQRTDTKANGSEWHNLYRPYDIAFKSSAFCSESDLKNLCTEAHKYGIKVIVDVVANHVDRTSGYHDTWWDSNGRVRWEGGINYGNRYSITHGQLGDYGDINSESAEVIARAKAYVQFLKNCGVDGIRWDAAKHIGLPSEGCKFWEEVTSVAGVWHYGEILDSPGPDDSIIKEYTQYMSVTDNRYSNSAAHDNGGLPGGYGGDWAYKYNLGNKCVYWGESHDTYSNDEWSQNVDQSVIDRAYAAMACRNDATALYFARPNVKGFSNIKTGKGTDAYKSAPIAAVNKFRNAMVGRADYFTNNGSAVSVTRKDGGAVIVMKGSGNVSIANGGGYCPAGTYTDKVSGGTFTVTSTTINGNVGSSGIAVIYKDGLDPVDPNPTPTPKDGDMWILGNLKTGGWGDSPGTGFKMTKNGSVYTASNVEFVAASGESKAYFNLTDYVGSTWNALNAGANRYGSAAEHTSATLGSAMAVTAYLKDVDASGCQSWTLDPGSYDFSFDLANLKLTVTKAGSVIDPTPGTEVPAVIPEGQFAIFVKASKTPKLYVWDSATSANLNGAYPGDELKTTCTTAAGASYYYFVVAAGHPSVNCIISFDGDKDKTQDLKNITKNTYFEYNGQYGSSPSAQGVPSDVTIKTTPAVEPDPEPEPDPITGFVIYYDNSVTKWSSVNIHYWSSPTTEWPGTPMTKVSGDVWKYEFTKDPSGLEGFLFCSPDAKDGNNQTDDFMQVPLNGHIYKGAGTSKGAVSDGGVYNPNTDPEPEPEPDPTPGDGAFTIYYDNSATDWSTLYLYYWNASGNNSWPGAEMIKESDNIWSFTFPSDVDPSSLSGFIFNNNQGGDSNQTADITSKPVNGHVYKGTKNGNSKASCSDVGSLLPAKLYVMGNLPDHDWDPSYGIEMKADGPCYVADDVELSVSEDGEFAYFSFVSALGNWSDVNNSDRFGAKTKDETLSLNGSASINKYGDGTDRGAAFSWKVAPGKYKITANFAKNNVTLGQATGIDSVEFDKAVEPVYFNLQGVKVANPTSGIYIVVRGNKVTKEIVK